MLRDAAVHQCLEDQLCSHTTRVIVVQRKKIKWHMHKLPIISYPKADNTGVCEDTALTSL